MIELQHRQNPTQALVNFVATNPKVNVADFDSQGFQQVKITVKADLNQDQGGLCVYCECELAADEGQVEHIKPKSIPEFSSLCFTYTNYAHSCINPKTCGQKKGNKLLPIEPGPGCNSEWILSTNGTIDPILNLNEQRRHAVTQTSQILGLNNAPDLIDERKRWFKNALEIAKKEPTSLQTFLQDKPYRYILATAF
jgi:uncharacterized protein (TIGR02646 family)